MIKIMWLANELYLTTVKAYNEKEIERDVGGLIKIEKDEEVDLRISIIPKFSKFRQTDMGRFKEIPLHFQVSKYELERTDFTLQEGKSHIIKDGSIYRVVKVLDASEFSRVQMYDCIAMRKIPVEDAI